MINGFCDRYGSPWSDQIDKIADLLTEIDDDMHNTRLKQFSIDNIQAIRQCLDIMEKEITEAIV